MLFDHYVLIAEVCAVCFVIMSALKIIKNINLLSVEFTQVVLKG